MDEYRGRLPPEELKNVEEEISELNNVVANKDELAESVCDATINLPRAAIPLFGFACKNRGSSSDGSLSQPAGPPPSIKHTSNPLHDFVEEPHRLLGALPTFDRAPADKKANNEPLNFDS